jgi:hypothetical protein
MGSTADLKHTVLNGDLPSCSFPCKKSKMENKVTVVLGAQWGDEGKGKLVDLLAVNSDIVCRCQVRSVIIYFYLIFSIPSILFLCL